MWDPYLCVVHPFAAAIFEIVGSLMLNGCVTTATLPPITEAALRAAAGERSFERGASYLGAVAGLETVGNQIIATVRGTGDYLVVLTTGEAGGLTVMRNARSPVPRAAGMGPTRASDLSSWLSSLSREELLAIVCDQVIEDDDWRRQLELRAASAAADVPAISARVAGLLQAGEDSGQYKLVGQYGYLEGPET